MKYMRLGKENALKLEKAEGLIEQMMALLELNNIDCSHLMPDNEDETSAKRLKLEKDAKYL